MHPLFQEKLYGKDIVVADREMVEERADAILREASDSNVAFLVVGDPFGYFILPPDSRRVLLCA